MGKFVKKVDKSGTGDMRVTLVGMLKSTNKSKQASNLRAMKNYIILLMSIAFCSAIFSTTTLQAAMTKSTDSDQYYVKTVGVPSSMKKYIRVADDSGFFNPFGTDSFTTPVVRKKKRYRKVKAKNKYKLKAPKYSLGFKNHKGYIKTYKYNSGPDADYDYSEEYIIKRKPVKRRVKNSGSYRTMCVRVKDGFYWPISYSRNKSQFRKDRIKCQKSCSGKVKLYYYKNNSDDISKMRDLKGKRYSSLKTAFLYRKKYVKGANCKPKPWSAQAKAVHKRYAVLDTEKKRRMHIAQTKRVEKKRVAALNRIKSRYTRSLKRSKSRRKRKARYRRRVARIYKRKRAYRPKKYSYISY